MRVQEIWKHIEENDIRENVEYSLYPTLMKEVQECLIEYKAVCHHTYFIKNKTEEDMPKIVSELETKLKEDEYIYDLKIEDGRIEVKLFLLEISEKEYKEISEKKEEMFKFSKWIYKIVSSSGTCVYCILGIFVLIYFGLLLDFMFIKNIILSYIIAFTIIGISGASCLFILSNRQKYLAEKEELEKKFQTFCLSRKRNFCNRNSNKKQIEMLFEKYDEADYNIY